MSVIFYCLKANEKLVRFRINIHYNLGLIMLILGIFPAIIRISSSFASLYESVLRENEGPAEQVMA